MKNILTELGVVPLMDEPVMLLCDNNGVIDQAQEPRSHKKYKELLQKISHS